jgi:hypothetical protein
MPGFKARIPSYYNLLAMKIVVSTEHFVWEAHA